MKKFSAIEGFRGWLAWTVVLAHLFQVVDAQGIWRRFMDIGHLAVSVFIIISGFVISHLITEKPEPYAPYIVRRFMRIFPLFAVTCFVGYFTTDLYAQVLQHLAWSGDASFSERIATHIAVARSDHDYFWQNAVAHLLMLHGAIGQAILPFSPHTFNPPAWSLSLEWQFYLIAPIVLMLATRPNALLCAAVVLALMETAYVLSGVHKPGFLPAAGGYFALGIISRLAYPSMAGSLRNPNVALALVLVLLPLCNGALPVLIWVAFMTGLLFDRAGAPTFASLYHHAFESRIATYFGSRSFAVYLAHFPILILSLWVWARLFPSGGRLPAFFSIAAMVVPLTILVAELLYRGVERPGIALGSRWARALLRESMPAAALVVAPPGPR